MLTKLQFNLYELGVICKVVKEVPPELLAEVIVIFDKKRDEIQRVYPEEPSKWNDSLQDALQDLTGNKDFML